MPLDLQVGLQSLKLSGSMRPLALAAVSSSSQSTADGLGLPPFGMVLPRCTQPAWKRRLGGVIISRSSKTCADSDQNEGIVFWYKHQGLQLRLWLINAEAEVTLEERAQFYALMAGGSWGAQCHRHQDHGLGSDVHRVTGNDYAARSDVATKRCCSWLHQRSGLYIAASTRFHTFVLASLQFCDGQSPATPDVHMYIRIYTSIRMNVLICMCIYIYIYAHVLTYRYGLNVVESISSLAKGFGKLQVLHLRRGVCCRKRVGSSHALRKFSGSGKHAQRQVYSRASYMLNGGPMPQPEMENDIRYTGTEVKS